MFRWLLFESPLLSERHIEIICCVVQAPSEKRMRSEGKNEEERKERAQSLSLIGCSALSSLKELEQHNDLFQYDAA